MPTIPELFSTAQAHHQAGRLNAAEIAYRQILAVDPNHARALDLLGVIALQTGNGEAAVQCIRRAIELDGNDATFPCHLGGAYQALRRIPEAIICYERALELQPGYAEAYTNLGSAYKQQGNLHGAIDCYRLALQLRPDLAEAHNNLGNALKDQGQLDDAVACYRRALQLKPDYAEALGNLGSALKDQGKLDEAVVNCRRALQLKPTAFDIWNTLGTALKDQGKIDEAVFCFRRTLKLKPDYALAHNNLGNALSELGQPDEAAACYHRALELQPELAAAHFNLGSYHEQMGDFDAAGQSWREALRHDPLHAKARAGLATLLRARLPDDEIAELARLAAAESLTVADRASLNYGMASVRDAQKDYAAAARHMTIANSSRLADRRARGEAYDPDEHDRLITAIIDTFSTEHFARVSGAGSDSERPVFVFGLPRTGTTLTEQIIASHSQAFGAGELQLAGMTFAALPLVTKQVTQKQSRPLECVAALDQQTLAEVAGRYLEQLVAFDQSALRIVDKMPDNYLQLGFLATLFPKATFIHCRRDQRDVAISCYMTDFGKIDWSNDAGHIASRFRAYERLMDHWRRVLPVPMLDVDYETTVADLEGSARRLVDWCGLDWEPQCLSFHTRREPIRTASASQVRQPIYQRAVGRWKHYEVSLASLLGAVVTPAGLSAG